MFQYPWGDFHSLNLGWFLIQFQEWVNKIEEYLNGGEAGIDSVARQMIAGQYNSLFGYRKYDICRYNEKLWICNTNLPTGGEDWNPSHWNELTVGVGLTELRRSEETLSQAISDETEARQDADREIEDSINNVKALAITSANYFTETGTQAFSSSSPNIDKVTSTMIPVAFSLSRPQNFTSNNITITAGNGTITVNGNFTGEGSTVTVILEESI